MEHVNGDVYRLQGPRTDDIYRTSNLPERFMYPSKYFLAHNNYKQYKKKIYILSISHSLCL